MIRLVLIFVLESILVGCKGLNSFYTHDRFQRKILQTYPDDTLYLSDFLICNHQRQETLFGTEFEERISNVDSIINELTTKLTKIGLSIVQEHGVNFADSHICNRHVIKIKHVEENFFSESLAVSDHKTLIIPLIEVADIYRFTGYMTSNLVAGDGGFRNYTSVSLIIFIIKGGEVIYSDHRRYASRRIMANSLSKVRAIPPAYQVKEEHIEELVRRAMKRYIKRLEK